MDEQIERRFVSDTYRLYDPWSFLSHVFSLRNVIASDIIGYHEMDPENQKSENWFEPDGIFTDKINRAWERLMRDHPVLSINMEDISRRAFTISNFLSEPEFHDSELYAEVFKFVDSEDNLCCPLAVVGSVVIGVGLHRSSRSFSTCERELLARLCDHVTEGWRNVLSLTRICTAAGLSNLVPHMLDRVTNIALIVLSKEGRVRSMTGRAEKLLHAYFPHSRSLWREGLPIELRDWMKREEMKTIKFDELIPRKPRLVERRDEENELAVRFYSDLDHDVLILCEKFDPNVLLSLDCKRLDLHLTDRESEVMTWLIRNKTNPEIAKILGSSSRTVQGQVQSILCKLEMNDRDEAALFARQYAEAIWRQETGAGGKMPRIKTGLHLRSAAD